MTICEYPSHSGQSDSTQRRDSLPWTDTLYAGLYQQKKQKKQKKQETPNKCNTSSSSALSSYPSLQPTARPASPAGFPHSVPSWHGACVYVLHKCGIYCTTSIAISTSSSIISPMPETLLSPQLRIPLPYICSPVPVQYRWLYNSPENYPSSIHPPIHPSI